MTMKLDYAYYWLFIMLILTSCADETNILGDEQDIAQEIELLSLPDPISAMFQFDKSIDNIYDRSKVLADIEHMYSKPRIRKLLTFLMESGVKIKFYKYPVGSSSEHEAECKASFFTTEISFISRNCITLANLLHELLHLYAYLKYKTYTDGNYAACEEYEIRVLTDLIMRRDFKGISFTHQGMRSSDKLYTPYIEWLEKIANTPIYNMDLFKIDFQRFGSVCLFGFGYGDRTNYKGRIEVSDLNSYTPRLMNVFWSGF